MKHYLTLAAVCMLLASPAFAADESYSAETKIEKSDSGDFKRTDTEKSTDAAGTETKNTAEEKVDVGSDGKTKTSVKTESSTDPEGMGNKATVKTEETSKADGKGNGESKTVVESKDANATDKNEVTKEVKKDSEGHTKVKVKHKKIHDPKGLGNKTTETTTETSVDGKPVETQVSH